MADQNGLVGLTVEVQHRYEGVAMGTRYSQLSFAERVLIGLLHGEGLSNQKIAVRLGRVASTIGRELRRNAKPAKAPFPAYDGTYAHKRAAKRRRDDCRCKLARQPDLQKRVGQDLAHKDFRGTLARTNLWPTDAGALYHADQPRVDLPLRLLSPGPAG